MGKNSPAIPSIIPPNVNEPKEIADHQVNILALYLSLTSSWMIVWVEIPIIVVEQPIIKNSDDIKIKLLVKPMSNELMKPNINIGDNNFIKFHPVDAAFDALAG